MYECGEGWYYAQSFGWLFLLWKQLSFELWFVYRICSHAITVKSKRLVLSVPFILLTSAVSLRLLSGHNEVYVCNLPIVTYHKEGSVSSCTKQRALLRFAICRQLDMCQLSQTTTSAVIIEQFTKSLYLRFQDVVDWPSTFWSSVGTFFSGWDKGKPFGLFFQWEIFHRYA